MESLGNLFKEKREALGLTLSDVSEEIKIGVNFLQAIEKDDFDKLPKGVYAKLFLKKYAQFLELDVKEVLKKFYEVAKITPDENENIVLRKRDKFITATESSYNLKIIFLLFIIFLLLASFFYYFFVRNNKFESFKSKIFTSESINYNSEELNEEVHQNVVPKVENVLKEKKVKNVEQVDEIKLLANGTCWIKVSVDGGEEKEYLLNNDMVKIKFKDNVKLIVGNAGVLDMYINGKKCSSLGAYGEVKTMVINRENEDSFLEADSADGN